MKEMTIKQTGITIQGVALLALWGGGEGKIIMNERYIPYEKINKRNILAAINDAQFGCECILSARIDIYSNFEEGLCKVFNRTLILDNPDYRRFYNGEII